MLAWVSGKCAPLSGPWSAVACHRSRSVHDSVGEEAAIEKVLAGAVSTGSKDLLKRR